MSPSRVTIYRYSTTDSSIEIFPEPLNDQSTGLHIQPSGLKMRVVLMKIDGGFIDYDKSLIYVRQKDFGHNPDLAYLIDGKTYIQEMGVTDGYGIVRKSPRTNKRLQKKSKEIDMNNYTVEMVKGLNAYKRFGIRRVYGVIVLTTKQ